MSFIVKFVSRRLKNLKYRTRQRGWYKRLQTYLWPNHPFNYPFKCRRYIPETDLFLKERVEQLGDVQPLTIDSYAHLIVDQRSETIVNEVVNYFNRWLIKSRFCPHVVTREDMDYMITHIDDINTHRRRKHLDYMFIREFDNWRRKRDEMSKREEHERQRRELLANFHQIGCFDDQNRLQYGFWRNSMFGKYCGRGPKKYSLNRLRTATLFGQKLVIDCSFDTQMQEYEVQSVGRQMARIYHTNRMESSDPFDIHYCGADPDGRVYKTLVKYMAPIQDFEKYYFNIHRQTYRELFPDQRFVYLSPDARQVMTEFDPSVTYILGSLVGKTCKQPLTKWKAEEEGLECYRLPIHQFVSLNPSVKRTLSFLSVFKILMEMKAHNDWELAFTRGIQTHKLRDPSSHSNHSLYNRH